MKIFFLLTKNSGDKMQKSSLSLFISLEGGEGAGKSSLIATLEEALVATGLSVIKTREPGGTPLGEVIRQWLLNHDPTINIGNKAELLLFLAARAQHIEDVIAPALKAGKVVLCDRFNDSTVAYQGAARNLGVDFVQDLCDTICGTIIPDITLYLDVDPSVGLTRTRHAVKENATKGMVDRIESEKLAFHATVRQAMLQQARTFPDRIFVIDASQSHAHVFEAAMAIIKQKFASYFAG